MCKFTVKQNNAERNFIDVFLIYVFKMRLIRENLYLQTSALVRQQCFLSVPTLFVKHWTANNDSNLLNAYF
jgi:hypothetical protein